jgi:carboxypeptidase C (cathepsin A)
MTTAPLSRRSLVTMMAGGLALSAFDPALAQPARRGAPDGAAKEQPSETRRLPADVTTEHTLELPGRALRFKATAGALPINDGDGKLQAEIAYVAYLRPDADTRDRPVTFVFNGGPGAASAYLQLGAIGPWRLPLDSARPSSTPTIVPNAETWLDFTDLVFIDPVGTGYSRFAASADDARKHFWSVEGDIDALAVFIRKWVERNGRQTSPKFIAGESYGGFRAPKLARTLQSSQGIGISGLVLISPALDLGWRGHGRHAPLAWVARLPSMAATKLEAKGGPFDREALREAEQYAAGEYLQDLLRGEQDKDALERMATRVSAYTGLDRELVRRLGGRVDMTTFQRERERGYVGSAYDATITTLDPYPTSQTTQFDDPVLDGTRAPLTSAMTDLYQRVLQWRVEEPYQLLNRRVSGNWDWGGRGRSSAQVIDDIRNNLSTDARMRMLVAHGASDLVTPYFENQLIINQLPAYGPADRLRLAVYGGGHMFYSRDASRAALRDDAQALYRAVEQASVPNPRG